MKQTIEKIWFADGRIWARTSDHVERSLPLEAFPPLFYATDEQRQGFYLWDDNRSVRWPAIDEDIHISNFYEGETVDYDNAVNRMLSACPDIDIKALADRLGIHWTLLARLRFGVVKAPATIVSKIRDGLAAIAVEM